MKYLFLLLFSLAATFPLLAAGPYCAGDTLHCLAVSGLKLRDAPKGKQLAIIPLGAGVVVDSVWNDYFETIENIPGRWIKVRYNRLAGYIFDGYLSIMPAPSPEDSSLVEYLDRVAVKMGKPVVKTNICPSVGDGEGSYQATIQLYRHDKFTARAVHYGGWEWGHESVFFDYVTFEEIFLLCRVIYGTTYPLGKVVLPTGEEKSVQAEISEEQEPGNYTLTIKYLDGIDWGVEVTESYGF